MNSISAKYKSLFYSLSIHLLFVLIAVAMYMKQDKSHEVHSLVRLSAVHFSAPAVQIAPAPELKTPKVQKAQALPAKSRVKKSAVVQKTFTPKPLPVKAVEVAQLTPIEEEIKPDKMEVIEEQEVAVNTESTQQQEQHSQVALTQEPALSYEAQYIEDNIALINALIKKNLSYPRIAKKRGLQGKTIVSFVINEEGEVINIEALGEITSILKKSAIKTIKKASSSFPHPKMTLALSLPVVYTLR